MDERTISSCREIYAQSSSMSLSSTGRGPADIDDESMSMALSPRTVGVDDFDVILEIPSELGLSKS
jgi:hypothetical protein